MRLVESSEAATSAERAALGEMRRQLREWEEARRQLRSESVERPRDPDDVELTYSRTDARAKVRARRRRPLRNGTLDAWLTNAAERDHKLDDNK